MSSNPSYGSSGINWGPWRQLPNGQWHREGQDASGTWYEDNQDEEPEENVPRTPQQFQSLPADFDRLSMNPSMNPQPNYYQDSYQDTYQGQDLSYQNFDQETTVPESQPRPHKGKNKHTGKHEQSESSRRNQERGKSSRSSKADVKGHSKSTRAPGPDVKGKGRESEQQPTIPSSSRYNASEVSPTVDDDPMLSTGYAPPNIDPIDDNSPEFSQSLQDVANMYSRGTMGGPSNAPMLDPAYSYGPMEEEETDLVAPLRGPSAYTPARPRTKIVSEGVPYNEDWSRYVQEHSRKFTFGTVFKLMWSEPMGNSRLSRHNKDPVGTGTSISEFGERNINGTILYEGIRRFIVVDGNENGARNGNSICVPIATYKKQGCTKHGVKPAHHGMIYTHDRPMPGLLAGEPNLGVEPVRLVVSRNLEGIERLQLESRINYSKHVTIEHNSLVHIIGHIHDDDLEILEAGVDKLWEKRVRDRKKDKKQEGKRR